MDILFDNPLGTMYGPYFLMLYVVFIISIVILLVILKFLLDDSGKSPSPIISGEIDPYEIAYLRGGNNELTRSAVFGLIKKDLLEFSDAAKMDMIRQKSPGLAVSGLNKVEQITFDWFKTERSTSEVFSSYGLTEQLSAYGDAYEQKLERQNLLNGADLKTKLRLFRWLAVLAIAGFGGYKVLAAFAHGRYNVVLIFVIGIIGMIAAIAVSSAPRLSKLGKSYLAKLQTAFSNLQYQPANSQGGNQTAFAGVDPLLLSVGIFGGAALAGTAYSNFNDAFKKSTVSSGADTGCGSSCSSESSSCSSGSSCGSSCGGGCGGCS